MHIYRHWGPAAFFAWTQHGSCGKDRTHLHEALRKTSVFFATIEAEEIRLMGKRPPGSKRLTGKHKFSGRAVRGASTFVDVGFSGGIGSEKHHHPIA